MVQAVHAARPGGHVGFVGVAHGVAIDGMEPRTRIRRAGSCAPFPARTDRLIWSREINPGKVIDLELPLDEAAAGYEAMDERRAIKALLHP